MAAEDWGASQGTEVLFGSDALEREAEERAIRALQDSGARLHDIAEELARLQKELQREESRAEATGDVEEMAQVERKRLLFLDNARRLLKEWLRQRDDATQAPLHSLDQMRMHVLEQRPVVRER